MCVTYSESSGYFWAAEFRIAKVMHCPFGVISVFFFFIKYLIETPKPHLGLARVYLSQLDAFSSGIHPHLLDRLGLGFAGGT